MGKIKQEESATVNRSTVASIPSMSLNPPHTPATLRLLELLRHVDIIIIVNVWYFLHYTGNILHRQVFVGCMTRQCSLSSSHDPEKVGYHSKNNPVCNSRRYNGSGSVPSWFNPKMRSWLLRYSSSEICRGRCRLPFPLILCLFL